MRECLDEAVAAVAKLKRTGSVPKRATAKKKKTARPRSRDGKTLAA
jgi:hypothetical protein